MNKLDQFFTKKVVARRCWDNLLPVLKKLTGKTKQDLFFIEPSAGDGSFYDLLPQKKNQRIGIDIDPLRKIFIKQDFISWKPPKFQYPKENIVVVGNPPFGHRAKMAVAFFNKAAMLADTIAFILPVIFRKYLVHKQLNSHFQWLKSYALHPDSFYIQEKNSYRVNTEFQIWTRLPSKIKNKRLFTAPPISHEDFFMYQYNNTKEALKVFRNRFDFAVPCQGWQDYTRREQHPDTCEKHKQWILFAANNKDAYNRLFKEIDYAKLSLKHTTTTPGFRKGDVVQEYLGKAAAVKNVI